MTTILHSSASSGWMTPIHIVARARAVIGPFDLDPASDPLANSRISAVRFFQLADHDGQGGLGGSWHGSIFLNPPGRCDGTPCVSVSEAAKRKAAKEGREVKQCVCDLPFRFWRRLLETRENGHLRHAIVVLFSVQQLQSFQSDIGLSPLNFPVCIPATRLAYDRSAGGKAVQPPHASAICYVPGEKDATIEFVKVFSEIGSCAGPLRATYPADYVKTTRDGLLLRHEGK